MVNQTDWPLIEVFCAPEDLELLQTFCWDADTLGIHESSSPGICSFIAYFRTEHERDQVAKMLRSWTASQKNQTEVRIDVIRDAGWNTAWHNYFTPKPVGERFIVHPPWIIPEKTNRIPVEIFPGQAFGTGYHESTQLCIELLERINVRGLSACDAGCGSGILTVIAILLGVRSIVSFDIDPIAIAETERNMLSNHLPITPRLCVTAPDAIRPGHFDLLLANLDAPTLRNCHQILARLLRFGGRMIVSGIVKDSFEEISTLLNNESMQLMEQRYSGDWVAMVCKK